MTIGDAHACYHASMNKLSSQSLEEQIQDAIRRGDIELYQHFISEETIRELTCKGFDVISGFFFRNDDNYDFKIYWGARASGQYINSTMTFYDLAAKGKIEFVDYDESTNDFFVKKWNEAYNTPFPEDIRLYAGIPGKPGRFYTCYEELFYLPQLTEAEQIINELHSQE